MWQLTEPNLLSFNEIDGGLARFHGWMYTTDGVTVYPDETLFPGPKMYPGTTPPILGTANVGDVDGTAIIPALQNITTAMAINGVAVSQMKTEPGVTYTAGATGAAGLQVAFRWIMGDGTVGPRVKSLLSAGRVVVSDVAPAGSTSVIVQLLAGPVATRVSGVTLVRGPLDLGPLDPVWVAAPKFGNRVWQSLPQLYIDADEADTQTVLPLQKYLQGTWTQVDDVEAVRDAIAAGGLSDPALIPDRWLGWVSQMVGSPMGTVAGMRAFLTAMPTAPAPGSRAAVKAAGQYHLTGTKTCIVSPSPIHRWEIDVGVRGDELGLVGGNLPGFQAALLADGQIPAGYVLDSYVASGKWQDVDTAAAGTWNGLDSKYSTWGGIDALGVTGP